MEGSLGVIGGSEEEDRVNAEGLERRGINMDAILASTKAKHSLASIKILDSTP